MIIFPEVNSTENKHKITDNNENLEKIYNTIHCPPHPNLSTIIYIYKHCSTPCAFANHRCHEFMDDSYQ